MNEWLSDRKQNIPLLLLSAHLTYFSQATELCNPQPQLWGSSARAQPGSPGVPEVQSNEDAEWANCKVNIAVGNIIFLLALSVERIYFELNFVE